MLEKENTKIIFMGTPEFASGILESLISNRFNIVLVVTQPDEKTGRKRELSMSSVKKVAGNHGLRVLQPESIKNKEFISMIREIKPDLFVVAAYGGILPRQLLDIPRLGSLNVHASILPKYRGASPIQSAILNGDQKTGVTIMLIDEGLDTGAIIAQKEIKIDDDDNILTLTSKIQKLAMNFLPEVLPLWIQGKIRPLKQPKKTELPTRIIRKFDGEIDWNEPLETIWRKWKAYLGWPGIYTYYFDRGAMKRLKIIEISIKFDQVAGQRPGKVIKYKQRVAIAVKNGLIIPEKVQPEGRKEMDIEEFIRGRPEIINKTLGKDESDTKTK